MLNLSSGSGRVESSFLPSLRVYGRIEMARYYDSVITIYLDTKRNAQFFCSKSMSSHLLWDRVTFLPSFWSSAMNAFLKKKN